MSGILMAAVLKTTAPGSPLSNSVTLTGGASYNVAAASGNLDASAHSVIEPFDSGGTPPYTDTIQAVKDGGAGSVGITLAGDHIHNTVSFSGLAVGDSILFHLTLRTTDSAGGVANARYPSSGSVLIRRTS